jgi:Peptidase C13 family
LGLFVRVATVLSAAALAASCAMTGGDPLQSCPAPPRSASLAPAMRAAAGSVPARRWHAVLVAGDNSSPAFDNGIVTLRDRLAERGVRDIELLSAGKAAGNVLATPSNLYAGLRAHAADACLVYMTSHGNADGFFLRAGSCLMGPAALDQALTESCGSAPTVVVVSACHSGTFLTQEMRKPNRVILTAAAADRASFGCSADNDYTNYDQCFLQQLDSAITWRDVALGTKACVEGLEHQLGVRQQSRPQLFFGDDVANLRLPGR